MVMILVNMGNTRIGLHDKWHLENMINKRVGIKMVFILLNLCFSV
jgi:hypothetical protein